MKRLLFLLCFISFFWNCKNEKVEETPISEKIEIAEPGMTLYTVRDAMDSLPKETLKKIAEIGYKNIEVTSYKDGQYYGMAPAEFKSFLDSLGLTAISAHYGDVTIENADERIAASKAAGIRYFVIPIPPMGHFTYDTETQTLGMSGTVEEVLSKINAIADKVDAGGLELLYHNHDFEFMVDANGEIPIDYFLKNSDPEKVNFQMDLYWVKKAGADPLAYFENYPGRFKMWHVKDMDEEGRFAPVGTGQIDFSPILAKKDLSGMEYYIVEQDQTFNHDPLEAIEISYDGLKSFGFRD